MTKGYEVEETTGMAGYPSQEKEGVRGYDFTPPKRIKLPSLRGWEFKLATGKFFGEKKEGGFFETIYDPSGAQADVAANVYAGIRTAAEILPYARYIFPSGRDEWARKSTTGQTIELGIEALTILPIGLIGKGLKVTGGVIGKVGSFPFKATKKFALKKQTGRLLEQDPFLDIASSSIKKYEKVGLAARAMKKYLILMSCIICVFLCSTMSHAALLTFSVMPVLVPEPVSMLFLGFGLVGITTYSKKKIKQ